MSRRDKAIALGTGAVFGFIVGLTSVGSGTYFGLMMVLVYPLTMPRIVGTDIFHAAALLWVAGRRAPDRRRRRPARDRLAAPRLGPGDPHLEPVHGEGPGPDDSRRPRRDPHHQRAQAPQRARGELDPRRRPRRRSSSSSTIYTVSVMLSETAHHARTGLTTSLTAGAVESAGFAAGSHDGHPPGPAGGHRCRLRDHRAPQADQEPRLRDARLEGAVAGLPLLDEQGGDPHQAAPPGPRHGDDRRLRQPHGRHGRHGRPHAGPPGRHASAGTAVRSRGAGARRRLLPVGPPRERAPHVQLHRTGSRSTRRPPKVLSASAEKAVLFAGPGRTVAIRYAFSEQAHAVVYLGRARSSVGRPTRERDKVKWDGRRPTASASRRQYVLSIAARDDAGNETPRRRRKKVTVVVRYIDLAPRRIDVRAGAGFTVRVETAAPRYTWRLATGTARGAGSCCTCARRRRRARTGSSSPSTGTPRPRSCGCGRSDRARARSPARSPASALPSCSSRGRAGTGSPGSATRASAPSCSSRRSRPRARPELAAAIVGAIVLGPLLAWLFRREPWLIAFATLAFVPFRVHFLDHQLLVPLYAVAVGAAALLLWQLVDGDERARELGIASWPLALYLVWIGLSLDVERRRAHGGDRPARLLHPVHDPRALDRAPAVAAVARPAPLRRARRDGARLRRASASTSTRRATSSRT